MTLTIQPRRLLTRILDRPNLVEAVRSLGPAALLRVVEEVGLEDAGELISLATFERLRQVFDEDVWRSPQPGADERFEGAGAELARDARGRRAGRARTAARARATCRRHRRRRSWRSATTARRAIR